MDNNLEFAQYGHTYLGEFVRAADQKAGFLLVAATALLGALTTRTLTDWRFCVQVVAITLAAASASLAVFSVMPRQHRFDRGLIAWRGIRKSPDSKHYADSISKLSDGGLQEIADHSHFLAGTLITKYCLLWCAIWPFILSGVATLILLTASAGQQKSPVSGATGCGLKTELQTLAFPLVYNPNSLELHYLVTNISGQNYTMPETFIAMKETQDGILHAGGNELGFPSQRFFPNGHTVEFSIWVNVGNLFDHAPNDQEKAQLEKQLAGTDSYMIFDEKRQCEIKFPAHRS